MRPGDSQPTIDLDARGRSVSQSPKTAPKTDAGKVATGFLVLLLAWTSVTANAESSAIDASASGSLPLDSVGLVSPLWVAQQVQQWAAEHSPAARMLDSERLAAGKGIDRKNARQCAEASLKQQVMSHLAAHERNRAAADALEVYCRMVALTQQRLFLDEALVVTQRLIDLAEQAESLGRNDQDPRDVRRQRDRTLDQQLQLESGVEKLRMQLAQLTGQKREIAQQAILIDPLWLGGIIATEDEAIAVALGNRADLRAVQTISQRLNEQTLPATRGLLAAQQPGLGMSPTVIRRFLWSCISNADGNSQDLAVRRQQISSLVASRREQIEHDVRTAIIDLSTAQQRSQLAHQRYSLATASVERAQAAIDLDRAGPGSDLRARLESLSEQGTLLQHQTDEAVAWVRLRQSQGLAAKVLPNR